MTNIKNKFIVFIVGIIFLIILLQVFLSPTVARDTNSYLSLIEGTCLLNQQEILKDKKYTLHEGDDIETKTNSIAVIEWGDGSISRMAADSHIQLKKSQVSQDMSNIQIAFTLIQGKSWSKVTSLITGDSYFKEYIDDLEAGVRGTEFEVNKDKGYLSVKSHEVQIKNTKGEEKVVKKDEAFNLANFSIIELEKFVSQMKDNAWEEVNKKLDNQFLVSLKSDYEKASQSQLLERFLSYFMKKYSILVGVKNKQDIETVTSNIENLSQSDKNFLEKKIKELYQKVHFAEVGSDVYSDKIYLRKILLMISSNSEDKQAITKSEWYDVQDMIKLKNFDNFTQIMSDFKLNPEYLKSLNINTDNLFGSGNIIPEKAKEGFELLKNLQLPNEDKLFKMGVDKFNEIKGDFETIKNSNK